MIYIVIPTTKDRRPRLRELLASIEAHTESIAHCVVVYENSDGGWVPAVYRALEGITGYVWLLGSDCIVEKDALTVLWDTFIRAFPDGSGVAEPFNELHGTTLCQHPLAHSATIKKYLYPEYIHWYSDNDFTAQALRDGKLIFVPAAKIEHRHFVNKKAPMDATYEAVYNAENIEHDRALYELRKARNFPTS